MRNRYVFKFELSLMIGFIIILILKVHLWSLIEWEVVFYPAIALGLLRIFLLFWVFVLNLIEKLRNK